MRVDQPGPVTDRITLLGRNESCVYLLEGGEEYAILGGGMTYIIPDIITQIDTLGIDPSKIRQLIIHHSHFDHVGIVPGLKRRWPWMKVIASPRAKELLSRSDVVETIVSLNGMLLSQGDSRDLKDTLDIRTIGVDKTVSDGDILCCGDLDLVVIEVPGHSSCSMAVYIPQEKALSASDAGGIPYGDQVFTAANSNFDAYQASLEKMAAYPTRVHLAEHYGALTGDEGANYMAVSMAGAVNMRDLVETTYARHRDEEKTVEELIEGITGQTADFFLPREVMTLVLGQMTRFIARNQKG